MLDGGLAGFADLHFLFAGCLFVEQFYIVPLANRTDAPPTGHQIPYSLSSMRF
jgi:hypothetical protein